MFTTRNTRGTNWNVAFFTMKFTFFCGMFWAFRGGSSISELNYLMCFRCSPTQALQSCIWQMSQNIVNEGCSHRSHRRTSCIPRRWYMAKRFYRKKVIFPFYRPYALSNIFQLYTHNVWNHSLDLETDITKHMSKGVNKTSYQASSIQKINKTKASSFMFKLFM